MNRVLEPELMTEEEGARAYAAADFRDVNQAFADGVLRSFPGLDGGRLLDLGCGPADIPLRLVRAAPKLRVTAVDGSAAMLALARKALWAAGLGQNVWLVQGRLPDLPLAVGSFDAVVSNSLLHHIPEPSGFWNEIRRLGRPGAAVYVMDLLRPGSTEEARRIVETAARDEAPVLKEDFYNSLLAAFTLPELEAQLAAAGLSTLRLEQASDRHVRVWGRLP